MKKTLKWKWICLIMEKKEIVLKNAAGIDTSKLAAKSELASLKAQIDKIGLEKLKTDPVDLS